MNKSRSSRETAPGRPVGATQDKVRASLLAAAREQFLGNEFKAVSVRRIAQAAGVNGAMVNYYFGSKQGLYLSMVNEALESLEQQIAEFETNPGANIANFSDAYTQLLAENPWWPNFIIREVLFGEEETRNLVVKKFAASFAPQLLSSIQGDINSGEFRQDLNPAFTLISLMGMTVFPFIAKPLLKQVLGLEMDTEMAQVLSDHNKNLFFNGVRAVPQGLGLKASEEEVAS